MDGERNAGRGREGTDEATVGRWLNYMNRTRVDNDVIGPRQFHHTHCISG